MDLDSAIQHCEEVADTPCFTDEEAKCYSEHRQLADWLKELKAYKEQSGDVISRQAALNAITMAEVRWQAVDNVNKLPSVTPQQMTGRWIVTDDDLVYCSECEDSYYPRPIDASWYYCPHCGAKMEDVKENG